MFDRGHAVPLGRQAQQLGIIYYLPRASSNTDLAVMRRFNELHLLYTFAGSSMLRNLLQQESTAVGSAACRNANEVQSASGEGHLAGDGLS